MKVHKISHYQSETPNLVENKTGKNIHAHALTFEITKPISLKLTKLEASYPNVTNPNVMCVTSNLQSQGGNNKYILKQVKD